MAKKPQPPPPKRKPLVHDHPIHSNTPPTAVTGWNLCNRCDEGTSVGQVGEANFEETEPRIAGEQIEEMAETGVNVLTNEGRASLPVDATELV